MERLKVSLPVIVEGKYDKIKLDSIIEADIFTTGGFSIFNQDRKLELIRRISEHGVIVLTDSDGAGTLIRSYISSAVPKDKIYQLYTPKIEGKEKRKKHASAAGTLGVEGVDADVLRSLFAPFADGAAPRLDRITKLDLFEAGLTGMPDSASKRKRLCSHLGMPDDISANAMLSALNVTLAKEEFYRAVKECFDGEREE